VKLTAARITPVELTLAAPLATSRGAIASRRGAVIELVAESGASGWGEALPLPGFGLESVDATCTALERIAAALLAESMDLATALDISDSQSTAARSARAAADFALHDLAAQEAGTDVAGLLCPSPRRRVDVGALLRGGEPAVVAAAARSAALCGFRTLKLKLTGDDLAEDEARVAAVREAVDPGVALRLDANGAWKEATACEGVTKLAPYAIEMIEQPVPAADVAALRRVRNVSPIPIAADEAVCDLESATQLCEAGAADVIVVKPAAVGGLRAARRIAAVARRAAVEVVVTSFLDSSLGIAAALQLAAALPATRFAAGLATAELLADDLASPHAVANGAMGLPGRPGLGRRVRADSLRRCATGATLELRP
jgi:o-succinylbenzoate synthase